jgi:hypothetical protein
MTARARLKEADIMRALRAAKKVGAKRVVVGADGSVDIWLDGEPPLEIATRFRPDSYRGSSRKEAGVLR